VLIDPSTYHIIGVEFIKHNQIIRVFANKEVILCAGAIGSSQLLILSGIEPVNHLTKLNIDVIKDAPIGENLMDHAVFYGLTWTINTSISLQIQDLFNPFNPYITDFLIKRTGPLTITGGCEALGFVNTKHLEKHNLSNIELLFGATFKDHFSQKMLDLKDSIRQEWTKYADTLMAIPLRQYC